MSWNKQYQPRGAGRFTQSGWESVYQNSTPINNGCRDLVVSLVVIFGVLCVAVGVYLVY